MAKRKLTIDVDVEIAGAKRRLDQLEQKLDKAGRSSKKLGTRTKGTLAEFKGFGGAILAIAGVRRAFSFASSAAIGLNATLETTTLQFETLMGNSQLAERHVRSLFDFAKRTPFETGPIIEASKQLQVFGGFALNTEAMLLRIGNASAATSAPINELAMWTGRLYAALQAGRPFGEAAQRLTELAVLPPRVRAEMEDLQKAGADSSEVFDVFTDQLDEFGGAMEKQQATFAGLTSTMWDNVKLFIADKAAPAFDLLKDAISAVNETFEELNADPVKRQMEGIEASIARNVEVLNRQMQQFGRHDEALLNNTIRLQDNLRQLQATTRAREDSEAELEAEAEALRKEQIALDESATAHGLSQEAAEEHAKAVAKLIEQEEKLSISLQAATTDWLQLRTEAEAMRFANVEAADATLVWNAAAEDQFVIVNQLRPGVEDLNAAIQDIGRTLDAEVPPTFFESLRAQLTNTFTTMLDDLPSVIVGAFQGGGDVGKSIGSFVGGNVGSAVGDVVTENVSKKLGKTIGGIAGGVFGPLGAIAGSFIGEGIEKLFSIGGPSKAELAGRDMVASFTDGVVGGLNEGQLAEAQQALSDGWANANDAALVIGVRDAAIAMGNTSDQAVAAVQRLWDSIEDGPEATQQAIDAINELTGGVINLDEINQQKFDEMGAAAKKYGVDLEALGPAFKQNEIDEEAADIVAAFKLMNQDGSKTKEILRGMSDEVSEVVQRSLSFGSTVPESMRPMIERLIEMGLLTDENGDKISSLEGSGITFAESLEEGMKSVVNSIEDLIAVIRDKLPQGMTDAVNTMAAEGNRAAGVFSGLASAVPTSFNFPSVHIPGLPSFPHGGLVQAFPSGGLVNHVPALVEPGEFVMSRPAVNRIGASNLAAMNAGHGSSTNINVKIDGLVLDSPASRQALAEVVSREFRKTLSATGRTGFF